MASLQDRVAMHNTNKLKLGLFGANCSNGRAMTRLAGALAGRLG